MASIKRFSAYVPTISEVVAQEASARLSLSELESSEALDGRTGASAASGGASGAALAFAPPSLTGGEHQADTAEYVELVMDGGQVKILMKRTGPDGGQAFIDWINFTVHEDTAHFCGWPGATLTDADIINAMSYSMMQIFGFGVTDQFDRGRNFYQRAYELGESGSGFLAHGGQRNTVMVSISGSGLAAARPGWEYRLRAWLENVAVNPKLTRVDLAHDCFHGEYTPCTASADYDSGLFKLPKSPKNPEWEGRGNWKNPDYKRGLTAYIGVRTSGKFCRVYEKGRQLGCPDSSWCRVEVEFKSVDRVLPFDMLTAPGAYLSGAYPAFAWISEVQSRVVTVRETKVCEKQKKEDWITRVAGADLAVLVELEEGETDQERALNLINRIKDESRFPKWAKLPDYRFAPTPIHEAVIFAGVSHEAIYSRLESMEV